MSSRLIREFRLSKKTSILRIEQKLNKIEQVLNKYYDSAKLERELLF